MMKKTSSPILLFVTVFIISFVSYPFFSSRSVSDQILTGASIVKANLSSEYPINQNFLIKLYQWMERPYVTIADINNDEKNELLLATWNYDTPNPGRIFAWDSTGALMKGFPIITEGHVRGRMALADLDGDSKMEIAADVNSFDKDVGAKVFIWRSDGTIFSGWPQQTACHPVGQYCSISSIAFSDINNDSKLEVIASTDNRDINSADPSLYVPNLYAWHSDGKMVSGKWPIEDAVNAAITGMIAVGDLDNNGKPDIVTGRDYNKLFAYDYQGNELPGWPVWTFYPYDSLDFRDDRISYYRSAITLADLDENGPLEYIVNGLRTDAGTGQLLSTDLLVYGANGKRWPNWDLPASGGNILDEITYRMMEAPSVGDINGDGHLDIVVATEDGWIRAYTAEKKKLWEFNYAQGKVIRSTEAVIGDVDDDGFNEVLFGTYDIDYGYNGPFGVWILEHTGALKSNMPLVVTDALVTEQLGVSGGPTLADLDGDGKIEIAAVTWRGTVYIWDAPGPDLPNRLPWPMPRHDLQRTAYYKELFPNFSQSYKESSIKAATTGDVVTYTIHLVNTGSTLIDKLTLTDVIPNGLTYVAGSLDATLGDYDGSQAPKLTWTGSMEYVDQVDISYDVTVTQSGRGSLTNTATVNAGAAGQITMYSRIIVNGNKYYIPFLHR